MNEITQIARKVKAILERDTAARDDDYLLYYLIVEDYDEKMGLGLLNITLGQFLTTREYMGLPAIDTIGRARRKVQEEFPELRGEKAEKRKEAMQAFIDFSQETKENLK